MMTEFFAVILGFIPIVFAITLHEAAHGYVAKMFGDDTASRLGRVSLNPLRHVDMVGTIIVPLVLFLTTKLTMGQGLIFGWAKPVPVNFDRLRPPKKGMLWVAAAGPLTNLAMAIGWAVLLKLFGVEDGVSSGDLWQSMCITGVFVNLGLMVLNLLPIPPLDGGRIAMSLLPYPLARQFAELERFGLMIMIVLLVSGLLSSILTPMIMGVAKFLFTVLQLI